MWWISVLLTVVSASLLQRPLTAPRRVDVNLYVMSRCPDARICEGVFEQVLASAGEKVNLKMGYIAESNQSEPLGYTCKHGELECIGNAHQLCLQKYLSTPVFYANLLCQNREYPNIGSLSLTKRCAAGNGVDWESSGVGKCIEGEESQRLLRHNVKRTVNRNVKTSCTIDIHSTLVNGGLRRCVVDGGVWRGCVDGHTPADFIRVIQDEWAVLQ